MIIFPIIVATCAGIQIIHPIVHANFFFSTFHIHPPLLEPIALYLSAISLLIFDLAFLKKYKNWLLFVIPFWVLSLAVYFKWNLPDVFWYIEKEDSLTEYLTFGVYILAGVVSYRCVRLIQKMPKLPSSWKRFYLIIFAGIMVASFVIAGEEISWGQRIIGFETPDAIAKNNTQFEFNIHNQKSVFQYVYLAYALLGFYAASAWAIVKGMHKARFPRLVTTVIGYFSPSWRLIGFFIPIIVYAYLRGRFGDAMFDQWEELMEIYLAIGILFFLYSKFVELQQVPTKGSLPGLKKK